jgi:peptidylprolyl isomerase
MLFAAATALSLVLPAQTKDVAPTPSPGEIANAAKAEEWVAIAASDLLVMDLAPDARGQPRRVVIQLMPAPISEGWIGNIRKLAAAHWWDGTSVYRVQDNYVAQWGDATEKKPLPDGLAVVPEKEYTATADAIGEAAIKRGDGRGPSARVTALSVASTRTEAAPLGWHQRDSYAPWVEIRRGWPLAAAPLVDGGHAVWPTHCYTMVGVARDMSPNTGSGSELYTVIGHAPRHLDRNIALVGRIISGMEHLSSLPRGTGALGVYEDEAQRVPILSVRIGSDLPPPDRPHFEYLSTDNESFARYTDAQANRRDPFFIHPAGGIDICNISVPVRAVAAK